MLLQRPLSRPIPIGCDTASDQRGQKVSRAAGCETSLDTARGTPSGTSTAQRERSSIDGGKWLEILSALEPGDERILCERATVGDARGERPVDLFITAHRLMWVGDDGEVLGVLRRGLRLGRDHGTLGHVRVLLKDDAGRDYPVSFRPAAGDREWRIENAYRVLGGQ